MADDAQREIDDDGRDGEAAGGVDERADLNLDWVREAVDAYGGPLLRYATRLMRGDRERARDAVQDTFVKLCRADRAAVDDHLAEWLYTVCRRRTLDMLRKEERMNVITDLQASSSGAGGASAAGTPASTREDPGATGLIDSLAPTQTSHATDGRAAAQKETTSNAFKALGELSANQQEVIRLKFQAGLSYKEIARVTDLSVSNVGFLIHTGLKKLRERLGSDGSAANPAPAPAGAGARPSGSYEMNGPKARTVGA